MEGFYHAVLVSLLIPSCISLARAWPIDSSNKSALQAHTRLVRSNLTSDETELEATLPKPQENESANSEVSTESDVKGLANNEEQPVEKENTVAPKPDELSPDNMVQTGNYEISTVTPTEESENVATNSVETSTLPINITEVSPVINDPKIMAPTGFGGQKNSMNFLSNTGLGVPLLYPFILFIPITPILKPHLFLNFLPLNNMPPIYLQKPTINQLNGHTTTVQLKNPEIHVISRHDAQIMFHPDGSFTSTFINSAPSVSNRFSNLGSPTRFVFLNSRTKPKKPAFFYL